MIFLFLRYKVKRTYNKKLDNGFRIENQILQNRFFYFLLYLVSIKVLILEIFEIGYGNSSIRL